MLQSFITVRYDRMQNLELAALCKDIIHLINADNSKGLELDKSFERFNKIAALLKFLQPKYRKLAQTVTIAKQRKRQEEIVTALLLHLKAIERAKFPIQLEDFNSCNGLIRKLFRNFVHDSMDSRTIMVTDLKASMEKYKEFSDAILSLGLGAYVETIFEIDRELKTLFEERLNEKAKLPEVGITEPSKEEVIRELRFLLQSIEVTAATHPEIEYKWFVDDINYCLTKARAQLRNTTTRRLNAK